MTPTDYFNNDNWCVNEYNDNSKSNLDMDVVFFSGTVPNTTSDQENGVALITPLLKQGIDNQYSRRATSLFEGIAKQYIPYYRQISTAVALECKTHEDFIGSMKNSEVAVDIYAVLDCYFKEYNDNRPFVLAGVSQGGAAVQIALENYFGEEVHRKYLDRLVAAYSLAFGVDKNWLNSLGYINFATGALDTGVLLSWVTEGPDCTLNDFLLAETPSDTLVINPINWKTDSTYANASECISTFENGEEIKPGKYNLQINPERGCLICDNNTDYLPQGIFGGKSLHRYETAGFYGNIRQNLVDRFMEFKKGS